MNTKLNFFSFSVHLLSSSISCSSLSSSSLSVCYLITTLSFSGAGGSGGVRCGGRWRYSRGEDTLRQRDSQEACGWILPGWPPDGLYGPGSEDSAHLCCDQGAAWGQTQVRTPLDFVRNSFITCKGIFSLLIKHSSPMFHWKIVAQSARTNHKKKRLVGGEKTNSPRVALLFIIWTSRRKVWFVQ